MENFPYRAINNEKNDKDELEKEFIETKLNLRKKKLYQIKAFKKHIYQK